MIFLGHHDTAEFAVDNLERLRLARFVEGKNFKIEAHHYPPGTSKYNPIEHRMFPHCSRAL